ncbi:MAG: hypothetical protein ABIQ18_13375 [Umezawaea sp.]
MTSSARRRPPSHAPDSHLYKENQQMNPFHPGRRALRATVTAVLMTAGLLASTGSALAEGNPDTYDEFDQIWNYDPVAELPVRCLPHSDEFRFRFYFNSDNKGAWYNIGHNLYDIDVLNDGINQQSTHFCAGTGNGAGTKVANNAGSAHNWYDHYAANVYFNHGFKGQSDTLWPNSASNLPFTKNNNKSIKFNSFG